MTVASARPALAADELESVDLADARLHAEYDLGPIWRRLRAEAPVYRQEKSAHGPGFWVVTRHADVAAVYRDEIGRAHV